MILASIRRKAIPVFAFLALCGQVFAALDVACSLEVRITGADTNAGGFAWGAGIAAPTIPTVTASGSGGTVAAATYYVAVTYTDARGDTVISPEQSVTTSGATASFTITGPIAATGAKTWSAYCGTVSGGPYFPQGTGLTIAANRVVTTTPPTTGTQPRGVDYSQQDSPQINVADGVANGTSTFTSATAGFTGAHVGNLMRTGATTWRRIVGVTNATSVTLDATVTTGTSLPVVVGGAFATPGVIQLVAPANDSVVFIKYSATHYSYSASTGAVGGGIATFTSLVFVGYDTTRTIFNSDSNRPSIKPAANSSTFFTDSGIGSAYVFSNIIFDNPDARATCNVIGSVGNTVFWRVKVTAMTKLFNSGSGNGQSLQFCDISVATAQPFTTGSFLYGCDWHDGGGIQLATMASMSHCNIYNITTLSGTAAVQLNGVGCTVANCNFYHLAPAPTTFFTAIQTNLNCTVVNNVFEDVNTTNSKLSYIFDAITGTTSERQFFANNFYYNVQTGPYYPTDVTPAQVYGATLLTASPFTAPGSGNFAPNNTAGGGAVIRGASLPTTFPAGTTVNALDAGAAQHAATGGASNIAF